MTESLYARIGGDPAVRRVVDRFYDLLDELPEAATLRALHPPDLAESRDKLYWFLSGWLGGPQLYVERRGHPRLRARHLPFAIDPAASDAWMTAMTLALTEVVADERLRDGLLDSLGRVARHMVNRDDV